MSVFSPMDILFQIMSGGSAIVDRVGNYNFNPEEDWYQLLLDTGNHSQDVLLDRRRMLKELEDTNQEFPYKTVLKFIQDNQFQRLTPKKLNLDFVHNYLPGR